MSMFARSTLSEDSDDLSTWEIVDNSISDDDDVFSFGEDDSMSDGPIDDLVVAMLSDGGDLVAVVTDGDGEALDSVPYQVASGDGYGDVVGQVVCESRDLLPLVSDDGGSRESVRDQVVSLFIPVVRRSDGYGNEEEDVDLDEDYDEDEFDDELMPWKFKDRCVKQRMIKKKGGSKSKIEKSKRTPYYLNRPGSLYNKAQHAYL